MLAVIDCRPPPPIRNGLIEHGFDLLELPPHPSLDPPVASHPDMLLFFAPDAIFTTKCYAKIAQKELDILSFAARKPIVTISEECLRTYPHDVLLNVAPVGHFLFGHPSTLGHKCYQNEAYIPCPVRQGYAKCNTVPVGKNALITSDPSIDAAARKMNLDVLRVMPDKITLLGYDTGFLGGATSFSPYFESNELYFCGDWKAHTCAKEINEFLNAHQKTPISLCDGPLIDLGTVFLIS